MSRIGSLIPQYVLRAVIPYFVFTWILLSVILFVQQAGRYADIFFNANLPAALVWQLSFALVPSVAAFTCPMAVLVGVIIGLSRMQGDSELTAVRAAGLGNFQILIPITLLGLILSGFALLINWKGVPLTAQVARKVGLEAALLKLESPVEPGVFNTEIWGYTVYVKSGDITKGTWEKIFIFNEDTNGGLMRLITSKSGRIDSNQEDSELVLNEAFVTTLNTNEAVKKPAVFERVENLRFVVQTRRADLIERLNKAEQAPEEMGLTELSEFVRQKQGEERTEAEILRHRRIILSLTPLLFALLGASLILRFQRGGRGFGIFLALLILIGYYLLALAGEQLARTGNVSVTGGSLMPVAATVGLIVWFNLSQRLYTVGRAAFFRRLKEISVAATAKFSRLSFTGGRSKRAFPNVPTGILDFDIVLNLLKFFALAVGFIMVTYVIFTAFELWKFAAATPDGFSVLLRYLFYLLPFIYVQIAPSCLMIATLATFVIKSRQNEIVTWTAAGRSVYRLLLPCFLLMAAVGLFNWQIQERVSPRTNRMQDDLRTILRNKGKPPAVPSAAAGRLWTATDGRIYAFVPPPENNYERKAVTGVYIFEFDEGGERLKSLNRADEAIWTGGDKIELRGAARKIVWAENGSVVNRTLEASSSERIIPENFNPFRSISAKPSHMSAVETAEKLEISESAGEKRIYAVALEKKFATIVLPLVITLFTAPFALSLSRKGKAATVGYAVGVWLLFTGVTSGFEQFGLNGYLPPAAAVWSPLILFSIIGGYLVSKVKT